MASEAPLHHPGSRNQRRACSGGGSPFGHIPCVEGALLRLRVSPVTPELISSPLASTPIDLKTGEIFYNKAAAMNRNNGKIPKLDLKLNLSLPTRGGTSTRVTPDEESPNGSSASSPLSSCLSSCSNSPEATPMVLAGCPRCLMYVMLSEKDPRCPKCKNAVLLDFLLGSNNNNNNDNNINNNINNNNSSSSSNNNKKTRRS